MGQGVVVIRGPRLEDLRMTREELRDDRELAEWEEMSREMAHEFVLGVPDLDEEEKLALVKKYAPGARWRVRVFDERHNCFLRCFFDPDTQKHYKYNACRGVYKFNPKTGKEMFLGI